MASLSFQHVYKKYEGGVVAVSDFNLDVADKEFVILVGPSGCGKSTTLRMLAGLEDISEGEIYIDDRCVNDVLPKDRDIAMVFQNYALYPHMSVRDNMAFALKLRKMPKDEINRRVQEAAKILEIEHLLDRKPKSPVVSVRELLSAVLSYVTLRSSSWTSLSPTWTLSSVYRCVLRSQSSTTDLRQHSFTLHTTRQKL